MMDDTTLTDAPPRPWFAFGVVCSCLFVFSMDVNILNLALPRLVSDLGATTSELQWIFDSYVVVLAGLTVPGAGLGDRYGRKRIMLLGLACFALASAGGAFAGSAAELVVWRGLMGVGAALVMPTSLAIIPGLFRDPHDRARAIGGWASVSGLALIAGPIIAGVLLRHFWWGSVFLVNIPIIATVFVLAIWAIPDSRDPDAARFDLVGALLVTVALAALLWATIGAPDRGWTSGTTLVTFAIGLALLVAFVLHELHTSAPMLQIRLLCHRAPAVAAALLFLTFIAMTGTFFLITQRLQLLMGYSPLEAALTFIPLALVYIVAAPSSARIVRWLGVRVALVLATLLSAGALLLLAAADADTGLGQVLLAGILIGGSTGLTIAPALELFMGSLPREHAGMASAASNTARLAGQAVGVAAMGSVLASGYQSRLADRGRAVGLPSELLARARPSLGAALDAARGPSAATARALRDVAREAFAHGASISFGFGAGALLLAAMLVWWLAPRRPRYSATPSWSSTNASTKASSRQAS